MYIEILNSEAYFIQYAIFLDDAWFLINPCIFYAGKNCKYTKSLYYI